MIVRFACLYRQLAVQRENERVLEAFQRLSHGKKFGNLASGSGVCLLRK
jgi:hypothetical protein